MIGFYQHGESVLHRLAAGYKLLLLLLGASMLFFVSHIGLLLLCLLTVLLLYRVAGLGVAALWQQFYPAAGLLLLVFAGQLFFNHWTYGVEVVLRLSILILLASLVTLTTRSSDIMNVIVRLLYPLKVFGVRTDRISLMLTLTMRYIPMLFYHFGELREAQAARGVKPGTVSLVLPLLVRALRLADQLAEAIEARAFDSDNHR